MDLVVRPLGRDDEAWKREQLERAWGSTWVARLGELIDAQDLEGFVAWVDGERAGLLTHRWDGGELEVVSIQADRSGAGVGRALLDAARAKALEVGAARLWLVTTSNNERAVAVYQQLGMAVMAVHQDGVAVSRALKPEIPLVDGDGRPIRDEIVLALALTDG